MTAPTTPFTLSIEPTEGASFIHGFHLGTDLAVARRCAEDRFRGRNAAGMHTRTVALIRDHRIVDVFDGRWASEEDVWPRDDEDSEFALNSVADVMRMQAAPSPKGWEPGHEPEGEY